MQQVILLSMLGCAAVSQPMAQTGESVASPVMIMSDVLAASQPADWRSPDPENLLYVELGALPSASAVSASVGSVSTGVATSPRVVIELAPAFAPEHVANVRALVREGYFDGLAVVRVQDNYVVQWADPGGKRPVVSARRSLPPEFERPAAGVPFTPLPDADTYAPEVGFSAGFPAARDPAAGLAWLVHCYGMVGAGRDNAADSGGGTELYVVTGHAPRQLDRNVTLLGRVLTGIELLTSLPRGTAAMGFYDKPEQHVPIARMRVAADVPAAERTKLQVLRTDTQTFLNLVEARRNRREEWFKYAAGRVDVCNVPLVVRLE